uniref:Conserved oligomeric Golgi complex subunit 4 n=1 Tax=Rhabditophanes sp. KR3021 TaxID=114890 RepID=A0AC35UBH9_9BILA
MDSLDLLYSQLPDLRKQLKEKQNEECELRREIKEVVNSFSSDQHCTESIQFLQSCKLLDLNIETVKKMSLQLTNNLQSISDSAANISGRVSSLDVVKTRIVECLQRISDLKDLKDCGSIVPELMKKMEYEEVCEYIRKFLILDSEVFKLGTEKESVISNAKKAFVDESITHSYFILCQCLSQMKTIATEKLEEALMNNNGQEIERFSKLLPQINEHKLGIQKFSSYLKNKVKLLAEKQIESLGCILSEPSNADNVRFTDVVTNVLEGVAGIFEEHFSMLTKFYGVDMTLLCIENVQEECNDQMSKILETFAKIRDVSGKVRLITTSLGDAKIGVSSLEKLNIIQLENIFSDIILMNNRVGLYWRFLRKKISDADTKNAASQLNQNDDVDAEEIERKKESFEKLRKERFQKMDDLFHRSKLSESMQALMGEYVLMEQYYMTESVKKAIEFDNVEDNSITSSIIDDVFFIVRKSVRRSITSTSVDCICALLNNATTLLETEFCEHLNGIIKAGYPSNLIAEAYQTAQNAYKNIKEGKGATVTATDSGVEKQRQQFLIALNNFKKSVDSLEFLRAGLKEDFDKYLIGLSIVEENKLENTLGQFDDLVRRFENFSNLAVKKLCTSALKPKIKYNAETYLDMEHTLTEEDFNEFEVTDPFIEDFIIKTDKMVSKFEVTLLEDNYKLLIKECCLEILAQIKKVIFKCAFNRLGGLQLDKEFRQLLAYMTDIAGWQIRDQSQELSHITTLLNSETFDEALDFFESLSSDPSTVSSSCIMSKEELKKILSLRIGLHLFHDFN